MHTRKQNKNILLLTSFLYIPYNKILCLTKSSLRDFVFVWGVIVQRMLSIIRKEGVTAGAESSCSHSISHQRTDRNGVEL